jgi:shikimate kinase/3-dehydroquinate synthase
LKSIVLSGFMATGKSTVGPLVAERLGLPFVDTDTLIEKEAGKPVAEAFKSEGEPAFRARELRLVEQLLGDGVARVIAFGGGTVTIEKARRLAVDRAVVVTLTAPPAVVAERVKDLGLRPNLAVGGDPLARARELMAARAPAYAECHIALASDVLDPDAIADAVVAVARRDPLLVPLGARSYPIDVCVGEPSRLTDAIGRAGPSAVVVVTDSNVQRARGQALEAALRPLALDVVKVTLPPGEVHKTLATVSTIWDGALAAKVDRDALVVAAGGGVVGDLAGFAAACLLRGVRFVQAPTTLLSMVDSSVGGKTGFDHPSGKNLVGAFHQPTAVVADLEHLETLSARERRAGLAEVVKIALATDAHLLDALERSAPALSAGDVAALLPVVRSAIDAKIRVVRDDERESGARALLNLGHTVGHALETHGGYSRWLHGEAVALGTVVELRATASLGHTPADLPARAAALFEALGLSAKVSASEVAACWRFVAGDKKRAGNHLKLPVVTAPGVSHVEKVPLARLEKAVTGAA